MTFNVDGRGVSNEQEEETEGKVCTLSYCGLCNGTGYYMGQCCPGCGGGS
jgi:DnaJ-class molecular chaperone